MEVEQYELCVDGVVVSPELFDSGSQVENPTWLEFDGRVERCGEGDPDLAFDAPPGTGPFAELDGTQLCFFVTRGRHNRVSVQAYEGDVRLACDGESEEMQDFFWALEWNKVYTVSCAPDRAMTLRVRPVREPLRDVMRAVLDGMNRLDETYEAPRAAHAARAAGDVENW
jgi:hypothetical protein